MTTLLVLNTTVRPDDTNYFSATLEQLEAAGAADVKDKVIFSDGHFPYQHPEGWEVIETRDSLGTLPSLEAIVRLARERKMDLAFFEDDLRVCRNAVTKIVNFEVPKNQGFVAFFDFYTKAGHKAGLEERTFPAGPLQAGVQALKIPLRSLEYMWSDDPSHPALITPNKGGKSFGRLYALKYFFGNGLIAPTTKYGMHFPHLVQHVGEVSAVNGKRSQQMAADGIKRESANYAGDDADALKL